MNDLKINIEEKPKSNIKSGIIIKSKEDIYNMSEIQEIKNAIQEYLILIGMNNRNEVRNVNLIGIGKSNLIHLDSKDIIRTALINASDKVIMVHNHPSNNTEPSSADKHITNVTSKMLEVFNVKLLDHIIVTDTECVSMKELEKINENYEDNKLGLLDKGILLEENIRLKEKLKKNNKSRKMKMEEREI